MKQNQRLGGIYDQVVLNH